jgi:hypothetical protein
MSYESWRRESAAQPHEKKATHRRRNHQEAARGRRDAGCGQECGGSLPGPRGQRRDYQRWKSHYGGIKKDALKRLRELEKENARLKRAVADLTLDKAIRKEIAEGKW